MRRGLTRRPVSGLDTVLHSMIRKWEPFHDLTGRLAWQDPQGNTDSGNVIWPQIGRVAFPSKDQGAN